MNDWLYVDKTRFVHALEEERYVFLIRPRRFGKSCWVSLLENYYDRTRADEFEAVFGGTHLGRQPTENRHRYVVLRFDFSAFDDTLETLRERFETSCHSVVRHTLEPNRDLFPEKEIQRILSPPSIDAKLNELFLYAGDHGIPLYVLIDEYDNFANTVLAHRGESSQSFAHGDLIQLSLSLDRLDRHENFLSLLYYFGLLSIRGVSHGVTRLGIPNQTVKRLMHRLMYG